MLYFIDTISTCRMLTQNRFVWLLKYPMKSKCCETGKKDTIHTTIGRLVSPVSIELLLQYYARCVRGQCKQIFHFYIFQHVWKPKRWRYCWGENDTRLVIQFIKCTIYGYRNAKLLIFNTGVIVDDFIDNIAEKNCSHFHSIHVYKWTLVKPEGYN